MKEEKPTQRTRSNSPEQQVEPTIQRRKPVIDSRIERQIIIGMILSNEFLKEIQPRHKQLRANFSKTVAQWCVEFYDKHKAAPRQHIEDLYLQHKAKVSEEEATILEEFLSGISEEYERSEQMPLNVNYLLEESKNYFDLCSIKDLIDDIQPALQNNLLQDAKQSIKDWTNKIEFKTGEFEESLVDLKEFITMDIPLNKMIIHPLMREGTLAMIVSPTGIGKTMLALLLSFAACTKGVIGPWRCENPTGVLYVDGEMSAEEMQTRRFRPLKESFPRQIRPFLLLTNDLLYLKDKSPINIAKQIYRDELYGFLQKREDIGLMILDNVAALTPGIDENSKQEWDPINQWLISLRFLRRAVFLLHHTGKSGKQRGTTGREDAMDIIISLAHPPSYKPEDGCRFIAKFDKPRGIYGDNVKPIEFKINQVGNKMNIIAEAAREEFRRRVVGALGQGYSGKDIAVILKCSESTVSHHRKWAIKHGFLTDKGGFTLEGQRSFDQVKID